MFDASYDRLNLLELLAALPLNPSEGSPVCPRCERPGLVFAGHGAQCTCANCGIDDDIIGLTAKTWCYSIEKTLQAFADRHFIPQAIAADLERYAQARKPYDHMAEVFAKAQANIGTIRYGALSFLLKKLLVIGFVEGYDLARIAGVCGLMNAADAAGYGFAWYDDFRKFAKASYALVFPLYARRRALSGFLCINKNGDDEIFVVDEEDPISFLGLCGVPARSCEHVLLTMSPRDTAGVIACLALHGLTATPIIAACPLTAQHKPTLIPDLGTTVVTAWSNDLNEAYRWAAAQAMATVAMEPRGLPASNAMGMGPYLANVAATSQPPLLAVALRLAETNAGQAALLYRQLELDPAERNCLLAEAPINIKPFISTLVLGETTTPKGSFEDREIRANPDGWAFTDGTKISNFALYLQETWSTAAGTMIRGVVVTRDGKPLDFEADYEEVQNHTFKWLLGFLVKKQAHAPYVSVPRLRRSIFDIAMSFGHPQPRVSGDAVHWDGGALVLPGFSITHTGEYVQRVDAEPNTSTSCSMLHPPATLGDESIPDAKVLWPILLHIAVNVTAKLHGYKSPGLVISGAGCAGWINALYNRLGLTTKSTAFAAGTCAFEAEAIFPPIVSLASEMTYREWIADDRHNAIISTPRTGLRVLRYLGWTHVEARENPSMAAVSAIPQAINLIRAAIMLGGPALAVPGGTPYFVLAGEAAKLYGADTGAIVMEAAVHLGTVCRYRRSPDSETLRLVGSMLDLQIIGDLRTSRDPIDGSVSVHWPTYCACLENHGVKPVSRDRAMTILRAGKAGGLNAAADHVKVAAHSWKRAEEWSGAML